jgi:hypothetical protein
MMKVWKQDCWCRSEQVPHYHTKVRGPHPKHIQRIVESEEWYGLMTLMYKLGITVVY